MPLLHVKKQKKLIFLLKEIKQINITINWEDIIQMQTICLQNGINGVGIPDLIIAQNALQHTVCLLSADKHFTLMAEYIPLEFYY